MKTIRIIPRLDIKGPSLVKGIHFEGLRVLGNPNDFAKDYYSSFADELMYVDVVASLYERNSLSNIISETAKEIFIPLTVGGGLRTVKDVMNVLKAGADKVSLNTAALKNPELIKETSLSFGSSTIVVSIEAIKESDGKYLAYTDNGREYTGVDVIEWAQQVEDLGAGEIIISSVDKEGTAEGFDIGLTKIISESVSIPVIAHGGAGSINDVIDVIKIGNADAVSIASILHYGVKDKFNQKTVHNKGNLEFLKKNIGFSKIKPVNLLDLKKKLIENNINCRI
jgi:imidazole glycerol-phosphate synthase subunit HisF